MDSGEIERFVRDGFIRIPSCVPRETAAQCEELLWAQIEAEPDDPATWTRPVYWVGGMAQEPFTAAANQPVLLDAFDALVGPGRWAPRTELGSFPLRFPHEEEPDDAGWHIEGSYTPPGETGFWTNVHSRGRALLMLFLFTDVDEHNAPTRVRVGSHRDAYAVLAPYGERGAWGNELGPRLAAASAHREQVLATGKAGDVYLCHPFLVHAAQPHHGDRPRFMGQPALHPSEPYFQSGPFVDSAYPVARHI
ncbi:phytanoyl-CoA dioxygenase family protein [Dactylosporangium matsuzakiense]|uniref:phytanoyl-CoA dioxygenase family protein n=1 Tax=Dactylosporangium matsuzakiense TaxID=53360 RepID=UPI002208A108|nr:phytanoyl-CoA dioxygenase family protein [Dactylosporangium matsuzakiense]